MTAVLSGTPPVFAFVALGVAASRFALLGAKAGDISIRCVAYLALLALLFETIARIRKADLAQTGFLDSVDRPFGLVGPRARTRHRRAPEPNHARRAAEPRLAGQPLRLLGHPLVRLAEATGSATAPSPV